MKAANLFLLMTHESIFVFAKLSSYFPPIYNSFLKFQVRLIGYEESLPWISMGEKGMMVAAPLLSFNKFPYQWAWTLELTNAQ